MQLHSTLSQVRQHLSLPVTTTLAQLKKLSGVKSWRSFADLKKTILGGGMADQPLVLSASANVAGRSLSFSLSWQGTQAQLTGAKFDIYVEGQLLGSIDVYEDDGHAQQFVPWPDMPITGGVLSPGIYEVVALWHKGAITSTDNPANHLNLAA